MKKHGMIAVRIFLSFVLAVAPFTAFAQASGGKGAAAPVSRAAGHSGKSVPDVSPDTVLVRFPVENGQPLEFTLKQLMDAYKIPGLEHRGDRQLPDCVEQSVWGNGMGRERSGHDKDTVPGRIHLQTGGGYRRLVARRTGQAVTG